MNSVAATLITLSLVLLLRKQPKRKQRNQRQYWMHPFNKERLLCGHHVTTLKILKNYDLKFRSCYRMSYSTFCELLSIVKPELTRRNTVMRQCISAEERLIITKVLSNWM